ncbi:MAG: hypothetical protein RQ856_05060 [Candidatus Izemoplasmatales bacterium]|nr:hypothetical protein [Candidatus Izemoplasmatales bacterium]
MFNVDFVDIGRKWLALDLRKAKIIDFYSALIKPIKTLNNALNVFRDKINYELLFNGQVILLERFLNDSYDPILRRIFITDAARIPIKYWYNKAEAKPKTFLYNKWNAQTTYHIFQGLFSSDFVVIQTLFGEQIYKSLRQNVNKQPEINPSDWIFVKNASFFYNNVEIGGQVDFIVNVPNTINFNPLLMADEINIYKLAGKRFNIITF